MRTHTALASSLALIVGSPAWAQCPQWSSEFHAPGLTSDTSPGYGEASATFDDGGGSALYIGGVFTAAEGQAANNVARWDGAHWSPVGAGLDGRVKALAVYDDGAGPKLYATGEFSNSGATPVSHIARWDGVAWSPLGSGLDDDGFALCVHDDGAGPALYVGGKFALAGGLSSVRVARWNGAWSVVGPPSNFAVLALASYDNGGGAKLYAGGKSTLAEWNGATWTTTIPGGFTGQARALAAHDDGSGAQLYATGSFSVLAGVQVNGTARWNGGAWSAVGSGQAVAGQCLYSWVDSNGPALYVGGSYAPYLGGPVSAGAVKWTASGSWSVHALTAGYSIINALSLFDDGGGAQLYATGDIPMIGDQGAWGVARFDGTQWSSPEGSGSGVYASLRSLAQGDIGAGTVLYAGGVHGSNSDGVVLAWNGAKWSTALPQLYGNIEELELFDVGGGPRLFAGGVNLFDAFNYDAIAEWDGSAWTRVGSGLHNTGFFSGGVFAMAVYDDGSGPSLFVAGQLKASTSPLEPVRYLARWDGALWSFPADQPSGPIYVLRALDDGGGPALYAGGAFASIGSVAASNVARFDGAWSALGSGFPRACTAFARHDDGSGAALYAASSRQLGPTSYEYFVARWGGGAWNDIGAWPHLAISAMESFDDGDGPALFVGGGMDQIQNPGPHMRKWQGGVWIDLHVADSDTTASSTVSDLAVVHDGISPRGSLFAIGGFVEVDGRQALASCRYEDPCACSGATYCTSGTTSSGCTPMIAGIGRASASSASGFTLQLTQLEGAKTGHIFYGLSGPHAAPWGASSHFLCVKAPSQRTGTQPTGGTSGACDGAFALDWNAYIATHPGALGVPFSTGTEVWAQAYFRDPPGAKTTALSNGLHFTVCP